MLTLLMMVLMLMPMMRILAMTMMMTPMLLLMMTGMRMRMRTPMLRIVSRQIGVDESSTKPEHGCPSIHALPSEAWVPQGGGRLV